MSKRTIILNIVFLISLNLLAQNSLYIGPYSSTDNPGRIAATGTSAEISLSNRSVTSFVGSPTYGERWVIYNNGTLSDGKLRFWTGDDKITFTKEGRIGVGTISPSNLFEVKSTSNGINPTIESENDLNTSSYFYTGRSGNPGIVNKTIVENSSGNHILLNPSGGNLGLGMINPQARLHIQHNGSNGSGGLANYGLVVQAENGQATIGAEGSGDIYANLNLGTNISGNRVFWHISKRKSTSGHNLEFYFFNGSSFNNPLFTFKTNGNLGIGVANPDSKLVVDGKIRSEEVKVEIINGPDYVFESNYELRTLEETKTFISENKHLPEIPSTKEMEANGVDLGDMNMRLLKKIEELTLYIIEQKERLENAEKRIKELENN